MSSDILEGHEEQSMLRWFGHGERMMMRADVNGVRWQRPEGRGSPSLVGSFCLGVGR